MLNLQPGLSGNPFFCIGKSAGKKDWERKTDKAAIKILVVSFWLMVLIIKSFNRSPLQGLMCM
ncbi:hypothetical protein ASG31_09960 [Chryseobacterium sp. Leaf404]|nr:hypothetical protein ASG31_09960 [Chryseobacterium sp. Leaf404]